MVSIIGYENYLITDDGEVWNNETDRMIKPYENENGYYRVGLYKNNKKKDQFVHRLVAQHYIINEEGKPTIDHINRDIKDNRLENLRWATYVEQAQNRGDFKNNTSGTKNVRYHKPSNLWLYRKTINGLEHLKYFKTKEEAIAYKIEYENNISL